MSYICKTSVKIQFPIHLLGHYSSAKLNSCPFMSSATSVCTKLNAARQKRHIIEICDNATSCKEAIIL